MDNITVALCAARTEAKKGDLYLDDSIHHALSTKFGLDWYSEGWVKKTLADEVLVDLMIKEGDKIKE